MPRRIMTLKEVAERIRVPEATLRWWRHQSSGPPLFAIGRKLVCYEDALDSWVDAQESATRTPPAA